MLVEAEGLQTELMKIEGIEQVALVGSLRRRREIIKNINFIVVTEGDITQATKKISSVLPIESSSRQGNALHLRLESGTPAILYMMTEDGYAHGLLYYTGSREFISALQNEAQKKNYQLNENGFFNRGKKVVCKSEDEILKKIGLHFIPAELREK